MAEDPTVTPIGTRLGSQRLYGPPDPPDDYQPPKQKKFAAPPAPTVPPSRTAAPRTTTTALVSTVVELAGITTLTAGCYLLAPWLGLVVAGLCLVLLGIAMGRP